MLHSSYFNGLINTEHDGYQFQPRGDYSTAIIEVMVEATVVAMVIVTIATDSSHSASIIRIAIPQSYTRNAGSDKYSEIPK